MGCKSVGSGDKRDLTRTWHRFPKDPTMRQKWCDNLNRPPGKNGEPWGPYKGATVCSAHFKPSCFHSIKVKTKASGFEGAAEESNLDTESLHKDFKRRRTLFPNAVPTENLGYYTHGLKHQQAIPLPKRSYKMGTPESYLKTLKQKKQKLIGGPRPKGVTIYANDMHIIEALGITRKIWGKMSQSERDEQRNFHSGKAHSLVEHSYSSTTLVGEERLADDNKRLRMLVEKLAHKIDVDRTKFNRVQTSLNKACLMLEQCSQYEFLENDGSKVARPKSGKMGKKSMTVVGPDGPMGDISFDEGSAARRQAIKKLSKAARGAKPSKSKSSKTAAVKQLQQAADPTENETGAGYYVLDDADLMLMHNTLDQRKADEEAAQIEAMETGGIGGEEPVEYYYHLDDDEPLMIKRPDEEGVEYVMQDSAGLVDLKGDHVEAAGGFEGVEEGGLTAYYYPLQQEGQEGQAETYFIEPKMVISGGGEGGCETVRIAVQDDGADTVVQMEDVSEHAAVPKIEYVYTDDPEGMQ